MTDITPPPELVQQWVEETRSHDCIGSYPEDLEQRIATRAAQWGADQELEACCEWMLSVGRPPLAISVLRATRRPKPPSLKEQALEALDMHFAAIGEGQCYQAAHKDTIRRALEALPDD
jgi:hypothetical protein